jgi:hypothetical protein
MWQSFRRFKKDECSRTRAMLSGYIDRRLNPEELTQVEEHLRTCQGCREEQESLRATVVLLHRLPEVTPSRSFALAPVKQLPGRMVLPALRFATAGAVLLLVAAFAVDGTGAFEGGIVSNPRYDSDALGIWGAGVTSEEGDSYWVVAGEENNIDAKSLTRVELVVPDGSDNVETAVKSLTSNGVVRANTVAFPDEVAQIALMEGEEGSVHAGEVVEFAVVTASDNDRSPFATNSTEAKSALDSIMEKQIGTYLNMVPAASDNNVLYSFNLGKAQKEVIAAKDTDWLRFLEYNLIGLVVVLGWATAALWLRQRRARVTEVSDNKG